MDEIIRVRDQFYILATSVRAAEGTRVLKHGDTFAVCDVRGDFSNLGHGEQGLYHAGTRFLSQLELRVEGVRPLLLRSGVHSAATALSVDLTNPDLSAAGEVVLSRDTLHIFRSRLLWNRTSYDELRLSNYALRPVKVSVVFVFEADFADVFEVRGIERARRGRALEPTFPQDGVRLGYEGLDGVRRCVRLSWSPAPDELSASHARFDLLVGARDVVTIGMRAVCEPSGPEAAATPDHQEALDAARLARSASAQGRARLTTSHEQVNAWVQRSADDVDMMVTPTSLGPYPYAGIPWFSCPFGRDGLITALELLWIDPGIARGVLTFLAGTQATAHDEARDAQPGKILHEMREGEMAALGEIPFGRYYGSVDATPLFVLLAGAYYGRTADLDFVSDIWPHLSAAIDWIDRHGDLDGDGFVEYARQSPNGLVHQGWKDSHDAVFHEDGEFAAAPIALCEVQGYVFAAREAAATLAAALGHGDAAERLRQSAARLKEQFEDRFWCDDLGTYALALDGAKRPCRVRSSNAGHCLFTGIASAERAATLAGTLLGPESFSGWGVRTIAAGERRYNPMSYHNGSVWPHDNAILAAGLARYGFKDAALRLLVGLSEAAADFELSRLPELFCGFRRRPDEGPTLYPVACAPQAWAAASVFMLLQAALGIGIDAPRRQLVLSHPALPEGLDEVRVTNLAIGDARLDLLCQRDSHGVAIRVLRREGDVTIVTVR